MIDDVRLAVLGQVPVVPIGGISHDGSGFGVGPALEPAAIVARITAVYEAGGGVSTTRNRCAGSPPSPSCSLDASLALPRLRRAVVLRTSSS